LVPCAIRKQSEEEQEEEEEGGDDDDEERETVRCDPGADPRDPHIGLRIQSGREEDGSAG